MTEQEKQLLLKDLCARLPYEVQCEIGGRRYGPYTFIGDDVQDLISGRVFKPYLRPMSSMTEEEVKVFAALESIAVIGGDIKITCVELSVDAIDWLNKKMFDYRGLIPMGLALEAKEGMYKTE